MAVHLARLSLWLTTLAAEKPLTFLDHHLLVGDSLVGASPSEVARQPPGRRPGRRTDERQLPLFDASLLTEAAAGVRAVRHEIEQTLDDTAAIVRRKEQVACGARRDRRPAVVEGDRRPLVLCMVRPDGAAPRRVPCARGARADGTQRATRGNGDPPSRRRAPSRRDPPVLSLAAGVSGGVLRGGRTRAPRRRVRCRDRQPSVGDAPRRCGRASAGSEHADQSGVLRFTRDSGLYRAQSRGHANQYQLFVERALRLARPDGRVALVVPSGIVHDHGCAPLRHLLLRQSRVESIVGFDNRAGVFPIHRSMRFVLLTATRGGEDDARAVPVRPAGSGSTRCAWRVEPRIATRAAGSPSRRHCSSSCPGPASRSRTCARRSTSPSSRRPRAIIRRSARLPAGTCGSVAS